MSEEDKKVDASVLAQALEEGVAEAPAESEKPTVEESSEVEKPVEETAPVETPTYSEEEQAAMAKGWKPADSFDEGSEGKSFVSAKEFLDREKFFDTISRQSKQIRNLENTLAQVNEHMARDREMAYKRALEELSAKKEKAVEEGDVDAYRDLEAKHSKMITESATAQQSQEAALKAEQQKVLNEFVNRNPWFNPNGQGEELAMTTYAIGLSNKLHAQNPNIAPQDEMEIVEKEMKKVFPHRYENPNKTKPAAVVPAARSVEKKVDNKITMGDLPKEYQEVCKQFCSLVPGYTEEKYIKDLIDQGVIKND
jgi:hypothetical protein